MYGVDHCHMLEDRICALDAELAGLRAANARLRELIHAIDACFLCREFEAFDDMKWVGFSADHDRERADARRACDAARRAVDEAGDLRT